MSFFMKVLKYKKINLQDNDVDFKSYIYQLQTAIFLILQPFEKGKLDYMHFT